MFLSESSGTLKSTCKVTVSWTFTLHSRCEGLRKRGFKTAIVELTYPYEDSLAFQVDIGDSKLVRERHGVKRWDRCMTEKSGLPVYLRAADRVVI